MGSIPAAEIFFSTETVVANLTSYVHRCQDRLPYLLKFCQFQDTSLRRWKEKQPTGIPTHDLLIAGLCSSAVLHLLPTLAILSSNLKAVEISFRTIIVYFFSKS